MENILVELEVEGVPVTGKITRLDRWALAVTIIEPFKGVSDYGPNVPCLARGHRCLMSKEGALSKYGLDTAKDLLENIFHGCRIFESERESLCRVYEKIILQRNAPGHLSADKYRSLRRLYRSQLRTGGLVKKEYDDLLRNIKKESRRFHDVEERTVGELSYKVVVDHQVHLSRDLIRQLIDKYF